MPVRFVLSVFLRFGKFDIMLTYNLKGKNKYYSLYSYIRDDILNGKLKRGDKLPSKRALAENLSVSVIKIGRAHV